MSNTVIVLGPPGCGKSSAAERLSIKYGCIGVVDPWCLGQPVKPGHLHLTNDQRAHEVTTATVVHWGAVDVGVAVAAGSAVEARAA